MKNILFLTSSIEDQRTGANIRTYYISTELSLNYLIYVVSKKNIKIIKNKKILKKYDFTWYRFFKLIFFKKFHRWFSDQIIFSLLPVPKLIFTLHDLKEWTKYSRHSYLKKIIIKLIMIKSYKIITVSEFQAKQIKKYLNQLPIVIENGIPRNYLKKIKSPISKSLNIKNRKKFIIYISNFAKNKGHENLLKNLNNFSKYQIILIGSVIDTHGAKMFNYLKSIKNVKILKSVSESQKYRLLKKSEFAIFPSNYEGFGIPIIESIICNKNILVNDVPSLYHFRNNNLVKFVNFRKKLHSKHLVWALKKQPKNEKSLKYIKFWDDLAKKVDMECINEL